MTTFQVFVSYAQLSVFDPSLTSPFNAWTAGHVAQGFAWRPGSVSFATIAESGAHNIDLLAVGNELPISPHAIRAIEVPFDVPSSGLIEVASISSGRQFEVEPGTHQLRYETLPGQAIRLILERGRQKRFVILKADERLSPSSPLLETATSA